MLPPPPDHQIRSASGVIATPNQLWRTVCLFDDLFFLEVDDREFMGIVTASRGQHVAVVGQRDDVERQVGEWYLLTGRLQRPAIGEEKFLVRRTCKAGRLLCQECHDHHRTPD